MADGWLICRWVILNNDSQKIRTDRALLVSYIGTAVHTGDRARVQTGITRMLQRVVSRPITRARSNNNIPFI